METWDSLIDRQPIVSKILINSIKQNRISHAYLIHGMRGTGKSTIATTLALTIFCESKEGINPCHQCDNCKRIKSGNHPDLHWIDPEGQSIGREQIDLLVKEFSYTGFESNRKVYIMSEIERLTVNAANRLL